MDERNDDDDQGLLVSGYGFSDDVAESGKLAAEMDLELGTSAIEAANLSDIRKNQSAAEEAVSADTLDDAIAAVQEMHAKSNVVLTPAELEEEAILLVIRERMASGGGKEPAKKAPRSSSSTSRHTTQKQRSTASKKDYRCFEDDNLFLHRLITEPSVKDDNEDAAARVGVSASSAEQPRPYVAWKTSVKATLDAVVDRRRRCSCGLGHNDEVSFLVSIPPEPAVDLGGATSELDRDGSCELFCVRWTDTSKRLGRSCRVDAQDRVVWSPGHMFGVAVASQEWPLGKYADLIHASGAQSRKFRGNLRDTLPDSVKRFLAFARLLMTRINNDPWMQETYCERATQPTSNPTLNAPDSKPMAHGP